MFTDGQLRHCHEQKAALIRESAANREAWARDAQNLHGVATWIDRGLRAVRKLQTGWKTLTPLLSFWRRRRE